jgi:membrane dipeptidase
MVTFVPGFVSQQIAEVWLELLPVERAWDDELRDDPHEVRRRVRAWMAEHPYPAATVGQVADHIDHVREVAGLAHVGIGGD